MFTHFGSPPSSLSFSMLNRNCQFYSISSELDKTFWGMKKDYFCVIKKEIERKLFKMAALESQLIKRESHLCLSFNSVLISEEIN